ncbi:MAG: cation transporter, partial [Haloarcula sp.]
AFETYALVKARAEMKRQIDRNDWSGYREAFRKTSDVTTLTALTEDTIALAGIVIALVGLFLEQQTGNPFFDRISALLIGIMLMGFALALAWENKRLLLGESLPADEEQRLRDVIATNEHVDEIIGFRTVYFGPNEVIVFADLRFGPTLDTESMDDEITALETAMQDTNGDIRKVYIEPEL